MDLRKWIVVIISFISISYLNCYGMTNNSPEGYWRTIDEVTGKARSVIKISKGSDNSLIGKVVKIYPNDGSNRQDKLCTACTGENHNKPIVGMIILTGLRAAPSMDSHWKDGNIMDPETGNNYNCSLKLAQNGNILNVRGFIGLPMFGRSQNWERVDIMADA